MAVIDIKNGYVSNQITFDNVWQHYHASNFLYASKLDSLETILGEIKTTWPKLLVCPPELFQMHVSQSETQNSINASVCAFRDSDQTYAIQHASSIGDPLAMFACINALMSSLVADSTANFFGMYYRPNNLWPMRLKHHMLNIYPSHLVENYTRHYLLATPPSSADTTTYADVLDSDSNTEVVLLAQKAIGHLRTEALGLGVAPHDLSNINALYNKNNLYRSRVVLGIHKANKLVGVALCYYSSMPINFSLLCHRSEIIVDPELDTKEQEEIVFHLAKSILYEYEKQSCPLHSLLVDEKYIIPAINAGFINLQKEYSHLIWKRESETCDSAFTTLSEMYANMAKIRERFPSTDAPKPE
jgi:hypothetical protein